MFYWIRDTDPEQENLTSTKTPELICVSSADNAITAAVLGFFCLFFWVFFGCAIQLFNMNTLQLPKKQRSSPFLFFL